MVMRNGVLREVYERLFDHHEFHPTRESIHALLAQADFRVTQEVWQAAYHNVLYLVAKKVVTT